MTSSFAAAEELFFVPAALSPRAPWWVAAHDALLLPLTLNGRVHRYTAALDGREIGIACVGRPKRFAALLRHLDAHWAPGDAAQRSLRDPAALAALDADLVAVETHRWSAARFRRAGWAVVPETVRWFGELAGIPPVTRSSSVRSDLAKLRKHGYTLEVGGAPADWRDFIDEMLLPQAATRYGDHAWIPSARLLRRLARLGALHFACRDGERVAGLCVVPSGGRTIWCPLLAVRGGDARLLQEGAAAAAILLTCAAARAEGFERIDAGRTSPFLTDGVQHFKRKWGMRPARDPLAHLVALRVRPDADLAQRLMARLPLLVETADGLSEWGGAPA